MPKKVLTICSLLIATFFSAVAQNEISLELSFLKVRLDTGNTVKMYVLLSVVNSSDKDLYLPGFLNIYAPHYDNTTMHTALHFYKLEAADTISCVVNEISYPGVEDVQQSTVHKKTRYYEIYKKYLGYTAEQGPLPLSANSIVPLFIKAHSTERNIEIRNVSSYMYFKGHQLSFAPLNGYFKFFYKYKPSQKPEAKALPDTIQGYIRCTADSIVSNVLYYQDYTPAP
ncbi:hypothetical protein [Chitinophaga sp.]|uniref:hypothetical protein n=1 Tax=Chitinophaga sp. TaxID=1869181 RepID=UPI002F931FDC